MALTRTTISAACAVGDTSIVVASATGLAAGMVGVLDGEEVKITRAYVAASTTVPLLRAQGGSAEVSHPSGASFTFGVASDFAIAGIQAQAQYAFSGRPRVVTSISATGTLALPSPGADLVVFLNGTSVITLTIPVPTKEMDGCRLTLIQNGAAAHVPTFTGGLSGAGSSYDTVTTNATAPVMTEYMAINSLWVALAAVPLAGTVTNITATVA